MSVPHGLPQEEALRRVKQMAVDMFQQYGEHLHNVKEDWRDNSYAFSFGVLGMAINGSVVVEPSEIKLAAHVPLLALPFRGAVEKKAREELTELLK